MVAPLQEKLRREDKIILNEFDVQAEKLYKQE